MQALAAAQAQAQLQRQMLAQQQALLGGGVTAVAAPAAMVAAAQSAMGSAAVAAAAGAGSVEARKSREIYIGNLAIGTVTIEMLTELFNAALAGMVPDPVTNPPVLTVKMDNTGVCGRLQAQRQRQQAACADINMYASCLGPVGSLHGAGRGLWGQVQTPFEKHMWAQWSWVLSSRHIPADSARTPRCCCLLQLLAVLKAGRSSSAQACLAHSIVHTCCCCPCPVLGATTSCCCIASCAGRFAFVEFRTEELATTAMTLDKTELCGRQMNIGRPKGYVPGTSAATGAARWHDSWRSSCTAQGVAAANHGTSVWMFSCWVPDAVSADPVKLVFFGWQWCLCCLCKAVGRSLSKSGSD